MIFKEIKNIKSDRKELRKFGIIIGIVLALWGGLLFWRGKDYYSYFFIFSVVFLILGIGAPILLKPIHKIFMTLAIFISWVGTRVILIVLFYLVFTAIGLLMRLSGKDILNLKFDREAKSYWVPRKAQKFEKKNYESQF